MGLGNSKSSALSRLSGATQKLAQPKGKPKAPLSAVPEESKQGSSFASQQSSSALVVGPGAGGYEEEAPAKPPRMERQFSSNTVEERPPSPESTASYSPQNVEHKAAAEIPRDHMALPSPPPQKKEPPPSPGAYLMFTPHSDGSLICHFNESGLSPAEAIVCFKAARIIPAFKFRQNGGRVEIIRKLQSNKQGYFEGVAQFCKTGLEFDSEVGLLDDSKVLLFWLEGTTVRQIGKGEFAPARSMTAIAALPPGNVAFKGVRTMPMDQFISIANKTGKAIIFR